MDTLIRRVFAPLVSLRQGESTTAVLMFAYSFLAMTAYNIVKPITRSKFIADLGADNLPRRRRAHRLPPPPVRPS